MRTKPALFPQINGDPEIRNKTHIKQNFKSRQKKKAKKLFVFLETKSITLEF